MKFLCARDCEAWAIIHDLYDMKGMANFWKFTIPKGTEVEKDDNAREQEGYYAQLYLRATVKPIAFRCKEASRFMPPRFFEGDYMADLERFYMTTNEVLSSLRATGDDEMR